MRALRAGGSTGTDHGSRGIRAAAHRVDPGVDLAPTLRRQDGVISLAQARTAGLSRGAVAHKLATGEWHRVRPTVFLSAAHPNSPRARVRAVLLWLGEDATLIGASAAWWWRWTDDPPAVITVAVPSRRRVRSEDGVRVVRRDLPRSERARVDRLWVSGRAFALVEAAAELRLADGAALLDRALLRHRVTLDGLRAAHRRRMGRPGSARVGDLLVLAAGGARSEAERIAHRALREAGIDGWVADHRVRVGGTSAVLDIAFPGRMVLVEIDGWAYHRDLPAFRRDRARQNALVLAGWTVVRVTWHDLVDGAGDFVATVRAALTKIAS